MELISFQLEQMSDELAEARAERSKLQQGALLESAKNASILATKEKDFETVLEAEKRKSASGELRAHEAEAKVRRMTLEQEQSTKELALALAAQEDSQCCAASSREFASRLEASWTSLQDRFEVWRHQDARSEQQTYPRPHLVAAAQAALRGLVPSTIQRMGLRCAKLLSRLSRKWQTSKCGGGICFIGSKSPKLFASVGRALG